MSPGPPEAHPLSRSAGSRGALEEPTSSRGGEGNATLADALEDPVVSIHRAAGWSPGRSWFYARDVPSSATKLFAAASLRVAGTVGWAAPVPEGSSGVYVVSLDPDPASRRRTLATCPISRRALQEWLTARPELRLDGRRPSVIALADRLRGFWLPDEVVLYVGLATSLRSRVGGYYTTKLGARRPHAGGYFLKTLSNLDDLYIHFAKTDDPSGTEDRLLRSFCDSVSPESRASLADPDHPFPFANLEWPPGVRKRHGITGARGDLPGYPRRQRQRVALSRATRPVPPEPAEGNQHRSTFTQDEIGLIRSQLIELRRSDRNRQKIIRAQLRRQFGFHISDYTSQQGFTAAALDELIALGTITVKGGEPSR
jgi:hypothetical protein